MSDVTSIVIAVVSLAGTLFIGLVNFGYTLSTDQRKRNAETEKLVAKYHDPLLLAAQDLQSRTYSIVDGGVAFQVDSPREQAKDNVRMYTPFLVGQYLAWAYILKRQAQFLKFSTNRNNNQLTDKMAQITQAFAGGSGKVSYGKDRPYRLYRSQQMAVGELLTVKEETERYCMGYAAFRSEYATSVAAPANSNQARFSTWFQPLIAEITKVSQDRVKSLGPCDGRMRVLQHLLMDLIEILDPTLESVDKDMRERCHRARDCCCRACKALGVKLCPSLDNGEAACQLAHRHVPLQPTIITQKKWLAKLDSVLDSFETRFQKVVLKKKPSNLEGDVERI